MRGSVRQDAGSMQTLKLADYEDLRNETNFLAAISPNVSSIGQLIAGNNNYPGSVSGVSIDYLKIRQLSVESGEMFTEQDIQTSAKVCVIGKTIADNLFPDADPIGQVMRLTQVPFRVVRVLKAKGYNSMGMDQDDVVLSPYTTVMKRLLAQTYLSGIFASALSEEMSDLATVEITEILRRNHKLKETDFMRNYIELMHIRLAPNVQVETLFDIPSSNRTQIAPLIFISLIENAFKHGISPTRPSYIRIRFSESQGSVECDIRNSYHPKSTSDKSGSGIGLEQVRKRLELTYPGRYEWKHGVSEDGKEYYSVLKTQQRTPRPSPNPRIPGSSPAPPKGGKWLRSESKS